MLFTDGQPDRKGHVCLVQVSDEYWVGRRYILRYKIPVLVTNFKEIKLILATRDVISGQQQMSCYINL